MKILIVGNHPPGGQRSMIAYEKVLASGFRSKGAEVHVVKPPAWLGTLGHGALKKWLGYIDKFILFPPFLLWQALQKWDAAVLVDHSNAMYLPLLGSQKVWATCHDCLAIRAAGGEFREVKVGWTGRILMSWITCNLARAKRVVCVSKTTKEDFIRLFGDKGKRIEVVPNGLNESYAPPSRRENLVEKFWAGTIRKPYLFHVGNNNWYKNRSFLMKVAGSLHRRGTQEVMWITAGKPWTREMQELHARLPRGIFKDVGSVSAEQLLALYHEAEALVFPSLEEGFGWPVIEAMASGCRVLTSNRPPMSEIAGDAALLADPEDAESFASAIEKLLDESDEEREKRIRLGIERAAHFSQEKMVEAYWKLLQKEERR